MSTPENIGAASRFIAALTPRGVVLTIVLGVVAILGYAVWEQRTSLMPVYFGSTSALVGTGVAITLVLAGLLVMDLYSRLEARAESAMRTYADSLQAQISLQAATITDQSCRIASLVSDHASCQKQVADLAIVIAKLSGVRHG